LDVYGCAQIRELGTLRLTVTYSSHVSSRVNFLKHSFHFMLATSTLYAIIVSQDSLRTTNNCPHIGNMANIRQKMANIKWH